MTCVTPARLTREFPNRYRLEGNRCTACGEICFPARQVCPACRGRAFEMHRVADSGKVITFTVIRVAGPGFHIDAPYALAVVELDGGGRVTCQVVDTPPEAVGIGMPVRLEFRRIQGDGEAGALAYGHKAVPA